MSTISSHVLDTSTGKPGRDIIAILYEWKDNSWTEISKKKTNGDGRIPDFGTNETQLKRGTYKIRFESGDYFKSNKVSCFHPFVEIIFETEDGQHYHIPLLLSPFGYTTYRGS